MSMISEQVNTLKELAELQYSPHHERIIRKAADTIESLSAKLQAANMERSTAYYNNGWIPCSERLPEKDTDVLIRYYNSKEGKILTDIAWIDEEGDWQLTREKAGYFPPNFKKEITKWMPLPGE